MFDIFDLAYPHMKHPFAEGEQALGTSYEMFLQVFPSLLKPCKVPRVAYL